ncbi:MAG: hypothetical protein QG651_1094 [Pseudomonadota bacterium]|nr:hypothetical protein [Pseudomonadota bacterium]
MNKEERKIIGLSSLGGMLELYDFAIYGTFSIYFAHQFFPSTNPYTVILQTYMVFLLGFILRPIGGLLFSHIGDEFGRKKVLILTIFIMGISSLGIALLPTYQQIGLWAPVLLLLCRLLQGLALGGELPTTYVYLSESLADKKILAFGITMASVFSGYLLAAAINYLLSHIFSPAQLNQFAWRIPFVIGGVICFISYQIRKSLHETKEFKNIMTKPKIPIVYLFRKHWSQVIQGMIFSAVQQVFSVLAIIFMATYLQTFLHISNDSVSQLLPIGLVVTVLAIFSAGYLWRKKSNLPQLMCWSLLINLIIVPVAYFLIGKQLSVIGGYILLMLGHGVLGLLVPLYLTALFPSNVRLSGVATCYNLSITSFAGFAPIIVTELIQHYNLLLFAPSGYILIFIILGLISLFWVARKNTVSMTGI